MTEPVPTYAQEAYAILSNRFASDSFPSDYLAWFISKSMVKKRIDLIKHSVKSKGYRDSIHGPFGKMPDERFNICESRLLDFLGTLDGNFVR